MNKKIEVKNENKKTLNDADSAKALIFMKEQFEKETKEQRKDYEEAKKRVIRDYKMSTTINWLMLIGLSMWIGLTLGQVLAMIF